ncbi:putative ribonuclease H-like domain-containing protein, partial [Tanacetum coccineum]
ADPSYSQDPKSSHDDGSKPSNDGGKKFNEDPRKDSECNDQEKEDNVNSTNNVNAPSTNEVNAVGGKTSIKLSFDPNMHALKDVSIFDFSRNDEDDGRTQKGNSCIEGSKLDRGYAGRASTIQVTRSIRALVDLPNRKRVIGTKWVFRNKNDERGIVIRNKVRLVAQRKIEEEVYVCQPKRFEDPDFPDRVYKVKKALYGLHQAHRAWYETLSTYLLTNGVCKEGKLTNLFHQRSTKATVKVKTVNGEVHLHALLDGKKIIINESIVRRDIQLEDAEGIDCLSNSTIFKPLALMEYEKISQKLTFYKPFFSPPWKFKDSTKFTMLMQRLLHGLSLVALWHLQLSV